jgi:hypothetical protein
MLHSSSSFVLLAFLAFTVSAGPDPVDLGTAEGFAILSKTGVTNVPQSAVTGNVGVSPIAQTSMTGWNLALDGTGTFATSTQVTGKMYSASDTEPTPTHLTTAIGDMQTAYLDASGRVDPDHSDLMTGALGGQTLQPGLYKFSTSVGFSSDCTISGPADETWIFQIDGDLTVDAGKQIILAEGAQARNIVWVVAGFVEIGAGAHFEGIILGKTAAHFITGSSINGRVLVQTAVTLQATTVVQPSAAQSNEFQEGDVVVPEN